MTGLKEHCRALAALVLLFVGVGTVHAQDTAYWSACPSPCQPQIENDPTTFQYLTDTAGPEYPIGSYIEVCKSGKPRTNANCGVWKKQGGFDYDTGFPWWSFSFVKTGLYRSGGSGTAGTSGGGGANPGAGTYILVTYWVSCTVGGVDCKDV